jgi:hypothetical protein
MSGVERPLFNVMVIPDDTDIAIYAQSPGGRRGAEPTSGNLRFYSMESPVLTAKTDLAFHYGQEGGSLSGFLEYREELFDEASMVFLRDNLLLLIQEIIYAAELPIRELGLFAGAARELAITGIENDLEF